MRWLQMSKRCTGNRCPANFSLPLNCAIAYLACLTNWHISTGNDKLQEALIKLSHEAAAKKVARRATSGPGSKDLAH